MVESVVDISIDKSSLIPKLQLFRKIMNLII